PAGRPGARRPIGWRPGWWPPVWWPPGRWRPTGWTPSAATATVTDAAEHGATTSPQPLAADLRSADNRDCPSRNDFLGAALADVVGGPVGRHALIGRSRLMTPLRVMFLIGLVLLALGWSTKAACLQSTGTGTG